MEQKKLPTRWNLREMFATDDAWRDMMAKTMEMVDALAARQGHVAESAEALVETARQYEAIEENLYALFVFAHSNFDQDMSDSAAKELYETAGSNGTVIGEKMAFLAPELMQYSMKDFDCYCSEKPELELYRKFAQDFFAKKEHVLSAEMENLMVRMGDLGSSFQKIFKDLTVNDMHFPELITPEGEKMQVCEAEYAKALLHPSQDFRREFYKALLDTYGKHINTLTSAYYGSVKADVFDARSHRYATARASSLDANHIPESVYDSLVSAVRENTRPLQEYVAMRKQVLGLEPFYFSDFFVPLVPDTERRYTYEEACDMVLKATAVLGEDYTALLRRAMEESWIDVYPAENKVSGAYSTGAYRPHHPYVLMNFNGTLDSVFTLAHELGHSMHSYMSNEAQPLIYADYSIFCAEVASTLNEKLLSEYLLKHTDSKEEKAMLLSKTLDDIRSTFYRQAMFADFEYQTHKMVEDGKPLLPNVLCDLHRNLNELYYGPELTVDDTLSYEWARIPHFYRAYYVYQYATGISAAYSIATRIFEQGEPAVQAYRRFLASGGSDHPIELLKIAGVDMASPQPVLDTVRTFEQTLEQLKELLL